MNSILRRLLMATVFFSVLFMINSCRRKSKRDLWLDPLLEKLDADCYKREQTGNQTNDEIKTFFYNHHSCDLARTMKCITRESVTIPESEDGPERQVLKTVSAEDISAYIHKTDETILDTTIEFGIFKNYLDDDYLKFGYLVKSTYEGFETADTSLKLRYTVSNLRSGYGLDFIVHLKIDASVKVITQLPEEDFRFRKP